MRDGTFRDASNDVLLLEVCSRWRSATSTRMDIPTCSEPPGRAAARSDGKDDSVNRITGATIAAQFIDYDNDGLLDLSLSSRPRIFRNIGGDTGGRLAAAHLGAGADRAAFQSMAVVDLDGDGDDDVLVRESTGRLRVWRNDGGERNASLRVRLTGRVSNRSALGAKVDLRAGSLRQTLETASASPAIAPADLIFGLGSRTAADAIRVLWPSGIVQAETPAAPSGRTSALPITELDRKPPPVRALFTWNGTQFEFVTDFMGGGEMGDWVAPSAWNQPDPDEYVRIRGDQLKTRRAARTAHHQRTRRSVVRRQASASSQSTILRTCRCT
jgi:hypothetical protein